MFCRRLPILILSLAPQAPLHNVNEDGERPHEPEGALVPDPETTATSSTVVSSPESRSEVNIDGTWGERDVGRPVNQRIAMEDFEQMQRELTQLSQSRSHPSDRIENGGILRTITGRSAASRNARSGKSQRSHSISTNRNDDKDLEMGEPPEAALDGEEFKLGDFIREGHFEKRNDAGESAKKVGVVFKNLTVKGVGSKMAFVRTLPDAVLGTFGPDLYRILSGYLPALKFGRKPPTRDLIHDFTGVVRHGEMMLVLGRPGSGCSTFLKAIANNRSTFAEVAGDVSYGGISADEQIKHYRGEVTYNPEDDAHFPALNVWQTIQFSLLNKTPKRAKREIGLIINALLKMFAITHTAKTAVGNEYVRGVSGGERKRVSIIETLATKSTVTCWDNSTRGLDASTALDYANSLRIMTDVSDRTTIVTLYQVGEGIYDLMDKVLVIEEGRMIFQGPAKEARQYFIDLGFYCPERQTTADFVTSVTDPTERRFREGWEDRTPKTPQELEVAFKKSEINKRVLADVEGYEKHLHRTEYADTRQFQQSIKEQKSKTVSKKSSFTVSFWAQVMVRSVQRVVGVSYEQVFGRPPHSLQKKCQQCVLQRIPILDFFFRALYRCNLRIAMCIY